jgi:Tfp pilus assembly protein PilF
LLLIACILSVLSALAAWAQERPPLPPEPAARKPVGGPAQVTPPKPAPPLYTPPTPPPPRAEIDRAWSLRQEARKRGDGAAAQAAMQALDKLRLDLGIQELTAHALALVREASAKIRDKQYARALELCDAASRLAPNHPAIQAMMARAHFAEDLFAFGKIFGSLKRAMSDTLAEPRHHDAFLANLLIDLGLALLCAAVAFFALLLVRHIRFLLHDVSVVLAAGKVLTTILVGVLLALPIVLGLGAIGVALLWVSLFWVYQQRAERIVSLSLLGVLAAIPGLCYVIAPLFVFNTQVGIDLLALHRGDPSPAVVARAESRISREPKDFEVTFLLAAHYKRRGNDARAEALYKQASRQNENHPALANNHANFLLATGRVKDAVSRYSKALGSPLRPNVATSQLNLAQAWRALAATGDSEALKKHSAALQAAESADADTVRELKKRQAPTRNRLVFDLPLTEEELRARAQRGIGSVDALRAQLWERIAPWLPFGAAPFVPLGLAVVLGALWYALRGSRFASPCARCGAIVDVVTNPELSTGEHCSQCHQIYLRGAQLDPKLRLEKEAEIHRHHARRRSLRVVLSAIVMGAGQVLAGRPARGAALLVLFFFLVLELVFWNGVVRYPAGPEASTSIGKAVLIGVAFLPAYLAGLAGVLRR